MRNQPIVNGQDCQDLYYDFVNVHSFVGKNGNLDHMLSIDPDEVGLLTYSNYYHRVCVIYGEKVAMADFCTTKDSTNVGPLPFILFKTGGSDRGQLYRCYNSSSNRHFYTVIPKECSDNKTGSGKYYSLDGPLGYFSTVKNSETPRPLYRCYNKTKDYHFLASGYTCGDYDPALNPFNYSDKKLPEGFENVLLGYAR